MAALLFTLLAWRWNANAFVSNTRQNTYRLKTTGHQQPFDPLTPKYYTSTPEPRVKLPLPPDVCAQTGVTLSRYILEQLRVHPEMQGIDSVFTSLQTACKAIAQLIRNAHFRDMHGPQDGGGSVNVQGEEQKKLDVAANDVLKKALQWSGKFVSLTSEEEDDPVTLWDNVLLTADTESKYIAAFDPLDGSSNVDAGIPTGTIFGIFASNPSSDGCMEDEISVQERFLQDTLQPGRNLVAAGYCLYSSAVTLVLSLGHGVVGFTLDESIGEFRLTHPHMIIPTRGKTYSFNEGNRPDWSLSLQQYIGNLQHGLGESKQRYTSRYIGSLAGDVHRTLLYGGIFGYPADRKNPNGKLRLLYEAAPVAFLVEQAGGKALAGTDRVLDVVPHSIHQRVPLILGSPDDVDEFFELQRHSLDTLADDDAVKAMSNYLTREMAMIE